MLPVTSVDQKVALDETRNFQIINEEDEDGRVTLSIRHIEYADAWATIAQCQEKDEAFEGSVISVNRGGCLVNVFGLRAFLPGSHLCGALPTDDIVGQVTPLRVS